HFTTQTCSSIGIIKRFHPHPVAESLGILWLSRFSNLNQHSPSMNDAPIDTNNPKAAPVQDSLDTETLQFLWTPDLNPLFWRGGQAGVASAWDRHVPFAHWIVSAAKPTTLVELGAYNGVSYSAFCEASAPQRIRYSVLCCGSLPRGPGGLFRRGSLPGFPPF